MKVLVFLLLVLTITMAFKKHTKINQHADVMKKAHQKATQKMNHAG